MIAAQPGLEGNETEKIGSLPVGGSSFSLKLVAWLFISLLRFVKSRRVSR